MITRLCEFFIHPNLTLHIDNGKWAKSHRLKWLAHLLQRVNLQVESDLQGHCHLCKTQHLICSFFFFKIAFFPKRSGSQCHPTTRCPKADLRMEVTAHVLTVFLGFVFVFLPAPHIVHSLPIQGQNVRVCMFTVFVFIFLTTALSAFKTWPGTCARHQAQQWSSIPLLLPYFPSFFSANPRARVELRSHWV